MATPTNQQIHPFLFQVGTAKHLVVVLVFDKASSDFTVQRNGNYNNAPNYTVAYTCGTGSATPTVVQHASDVTTDLGAQGVTVYLNQSLQVVLEQVPDNFQWVKCTA